MVDGRYNIEEFATWLTKLTVKNSSQTPSPSNFNDYTVNDYERVALLSGQPQEKGASLSELMRGDSKIVGTSTIEEINVIIDAVGENIGIPNRNLTRVEIEAFGYPFGVADDMSPVLLAKQTHKLLLLQFDELLVNAKVPLESAKELGAWCITGLADIKNKSVWG